MQVDDFARHGVRTCRSRLDAIGFNEFERVNGLQVPIPVDLDIAPQGAVCTTGHLSPASLFFLLVSQCNPGVDLVTLSEFELHLLQSGTVRSLHPGMANHVHNRRSVEGMILKHQSDQLLELWIERFANVSLMHLPESSRVVSIEHTVVFVLRDCHVEGRIANVEDENDDTEGEEVGFNPFVGRALKNLRRHVA